MKKYNIEIRDEVYYEGIEANSRDEAVEIALEWFGERWPDIWTEEVKED